MLLCSDPFILYNPYSLIIRSLWYFTYAFSLKSLRFYFPSPIILLSYLVLFCIRYVTSEYQESRQFRYADSSLIQVQRSLTLGYRKLLQSYHMEIVFLTTRAQFIFWYFLVHFWLLYIGHWPCVVRCITGMNTEPVIFAVKVSIARLRNFDITTATSRATRDILEATERLGQSRTLES